MNIVSENFLQEIEPLFSGLTLKGEWLGELYSVSLFNAIESYQIDIVSNEVGVTYRKPEEIDFSGSDISFTNTNEAINFLIDYRSKMVKSAQ
jgi:hypothetical protein